MFILKNNPSLRRMSQIRRNFGATCTLKGIAVRRSLSVRSCFGAWCTNSYTSEKTTSNGEFIRTDTRATKFLAGAHYTQAQGRSMVEMLGVMAIIGVLSVGAIAGYSKAMMKYKLNKQSEQLTQILFSLEHYREMLGRDRDNIANNTYVIALLIKLNAIPLEMIKPDNTDVIYDVFGNKITIRYYGSAESQSSNYNIVVYYQPNQYDVCNNVFELIKANSEKLYTAGVKIQSDGNFASPILNATTINSINKSDIYDYCALCKSGRYCRVSSTFKFN